MNQVAIRPSTSLQTLEGQQAVVLRLRGELSDRPGNDELVIAAKMLIAPYPHAKPADPSGWVRTMVAHLAKYPRFLLQRIVDPAHGIVTQCVFPPVIAEIEKFAAPIWDEAARKLQSADDTVKQLTPPEREQSQEERAYIHDGLKKLAKQLASNMDMEKAAKQ